MIGCLIFINVVDRGRFRIMKMVAGFLIACCAFFFAGTATAEMYKWVDEEGVVHFSDAPVATKETRADIETIQSVGTAAGTDVFSDEWFDRDEEYNRSLQAASNFLEQHENWPVTPIFDKFTTAYAGQHTAGIGFHAKIPDVMLEGSDCAIAQQRIIVMREYDPVNRRRCRITNVKLGDKILVPTNCLKK
jgi:hypothetical protein